MTAGQPLRGFVGQGMDGRKKAFIPYTASISCGSYTWTCPRSGYYRLVNWGPGGSGASSASGAHTQSVVLMARGQTIAVVSGSFGSANDSTFTLPSGRVIRAGSAATTTPGAASGGDLNLNGSAAGAAGLGDAGGAANGGAGSPGNGTYRGADAGSYGVGAGTTAGASGPGDGLSLIVRAANSLL